MEQLEMFQVCPSCKVFHSPKTGVCECCGHNTVKKIDQAERIRQEFDKQFVNDVL